MTNAVRHSRVLGGRIDIGAVERQPIPATTLGDYNQNGVADAADYVLWRKTQGAVGVTPYTGADGSGNGSVGLEDHTFWRTHFGLIVPVAGAGSGASSEEVASVDPEAIVEAAAFELAPVESSLQQKRPPAASWHTPPTTDDLLGVMPTVAAGERSRNKHRARLVSFEMPHDDALLAWVSSSRKPAGPAVNESAITPSDSIECDAIHTAMDELFGLQLLQSSM